MLRRLFGTANSIFLNVERSLRHFSTKKIPSRMQAWCLHRYDENNVPIFDNVDVQTSLKANEVLVQVKAASLNPIDAMMPKGFGSVLLNCLKKLNKSELTEFPVILGRDFSGVVVKTGAQVTRVSEGDEVMLWDGLTSLHGVLRQDLLQEPIMYYHSVRGGGIY